MPDVFTTLYKPDVLSCLADLSNDEVFTPPSVVNDMLDMLPQELFESTDTTFLDPVCKSGVFLREIAKRLIKGLEDKIPDLQERIDHIFQKQLFGIAITELTSLLSRRSVYCSKYPNSKYSVSQFDDVQGNIRYKNVAHEWVKGKCCFCGATESEYGTQKRDGMENHAYEFIHTTKPQEIYNMKFDVIIGNPPYQLSDGGGTGSSAIPIYQKFVSAAKRMKPRYISMIIPSRWFAGGKGLDDFRAEMLSDRRICELHDYVNANDCFPGVAIEGGVCYFLWKRDYSGDCNVVMHSADMIVSKTQRPLLEKGADVFIRYNQLITIIRKIAAFNEPSFSSLVSARNPYGLTNDNIEDIGFKTSNTVSVLYISNKKRTYCNIPTTSILKNQLEISTYRLYISKADGAAGQIGYPIPARIIGKAEIAEPKTVCSETFLRIGPFINKQEAENVRAYMYTKFFRALIGARKNKNMTQSTYSFAPIQDFSKPWTDAELYAKYKLTREEIDFIESMIQPME